MRPTIFWARWRGGRGRRSDVLVMTGDRDMFQLVDDHIQILYTSGGPNPITSVYGLAEVTARYGLTPQQFIDFKALTGDASTTSPACRAWARRRRSSFCNNTARSMTCNADLYVISGPKTRQVLADACALVLQNRRLVTISTDLDLRFEPDLAATRDHDQEAVVALFEELEFRSLIKELPSFYVVTTPSAADAGPDSGQISLFGDAPSPDVSLAPTASDAQCEVSIVNDQSTLDAGRWPRLRGAGANFLRCRDDRHPRDEGAGRAGVGVGAGSGRLYSRGPYYRGP